MPFDGTDFEDGRQPHRDPADDPAVGVFIVVSAVLLLLPVSLGSLAAVLSYLIGK